MDAATATDLSALNALTAAQSNWFQFGGNTYLVIDNATTVATDTIDTTTFQDGVDSVICLTGLVNLTTAATVSDVLTLA